MNGYTQKEAQNRLSPMNMGSVNSPCVPLKQSELGNSTEALEKCIAELDNQLSELRERLTPVLRNEPPSGIAEQPCPSYASGAAQRIGQQVQRVREIQRRVGEMLSLLEA